MTDTEILDWLERNHTLHNEVALLYVVDGCEVTVLRDEEIISGPHHGTTLRDAIIEAAKNFDISPT